MGQKVRPTGFRTGIMIDWQSNWYASKADFSELLIEDVKIRRFVKSRYRGAGISKIRIQRTREKVTVFIHSARVGVIIGKKGAEVDKLTKDLEDLCHRHIEVKTVEINRPEIDPVLVAEDIAEDLQKRQGFRRVMKKVAGGNDVCRRQRDQSADRGPAGRRGNGPVGRQHGREHPAVYVAGPDRLRLHRGQDCPGQHRC